MKKTTLLLIGFVGISVAVGYKLLSGDAVEREHRQAVVETNRIRAEQVEAKEKLLQEITREVDELEMAFMDSTNLWNDDEDEIRSVLLRLQDLSRKSDIPIELRSRINRLMDQCKKEL